MKQYTPEKLVAVSRYRRYVPTLSRELQSDIFARIRELIAEEKRYCDQGNHKHMAQIFTSIAVYQTLQEHGLSEAEAYKITSEEMWKALGHEESLVKVAWPVCDESALVKDEITIIVQINGKLKERLSVPSGLSKDELEAAVTGSEEVGELLAGKNVVKTIVVPGKLVNFVVK